MFILVISIQNEKRSEKKTPQRSVLLGNCLTQCQG